MTNHQIHPVCLYMYNETEMCRPCLKGTIQNAETAVVKCPYTDQDYSCDMQLLDREMKSVSEPPFSNSFGERLRESMFWCCTQIFRI